MNGLTSYILSKKYVDLTAASLGAVKGAPCTIKSQTETDDSYIVTFEWTGTSGTTETSQLVIKKPKDGVDGYTPIKNVDYFDGQQGKDGEKGADGLDGVGISKIEKIGTVDLVDTYRITFTDNSTFDYEVTNGKDGTGGGTVDAPIESISVNGVNVEPDENKNVDITVPSTEGLVSETWVNEQGFLTEHQDLSNYATKDEIPSLDDYAKSSELPTKVSDLANDSNFQTADDITATLAPYAKSTDVTNEIITEVAKIVADAPEDFDTLKEMSDWIAGHENDATAMNSAIQKNKTDIETLQTDKADASDLTAHTEDSKIHVTVEDKTLWNTVSVKVDKIEGKGLSSNDYTDEDKALVTTVEDKVDKTSIATTLSSELTNDEVVGAKLAYDELQEVKSATKEQFNTSSGDSITVTDAVDGNIVELGVKGNSFQQTYSGKNLLKYPYAQTTRTNNGVTFTDVGDGSVLANRVDSSITETAYFQPTYRLGDDQSNLYLEDGNYTMYCFGGDSNCYLEIFATKADESEVIVFGNTRNSGVLNFTINNSEYANNGQLGVTFYVKTEATVSNRSFRFMICKGTLDSTETYEPYVGGIPAPNPDYPQTINSVGDDGSLVVTSCGKNVLKNIKGDSFSHMGITYTKNSDGSISCTGTQTNHSYLLMNNDLKVDLNGKYILSGNTTENSNEWGYCLFLQLELEDGAYRYLFNNNPDEVVCDFSQYPTLKYVRPYIRIGKDATALTDKTITFYPMLRPYGTDGTYEPYKESTSTIPLSEPLRSIGDIKDEITYQDGKWGVLRRIKEKVITSTSKINPDGALAGETYDVCIDLGTFNDSYCVVNQISDISKSIFDKFVSKNTWAVDECGAYISWAGNAFARMSSSICGSTLDEVNTYLSNNPITTDYVLATPVFEPFADQTLPYLSTYDGVTNIFNDDALSAEMTVKYPTTDASGVGSRNEAKITEVKNDVDELEKAVGNTDISAIGDGTVTSAISSMNGNFDYSSGTVTLNSNTTSYVGYEKYGRLVHIKGLFVVNTAIAQNDIIIILPFESITTHGIFLRDKTGSATQCSFVTTGIKVVSNTLPIGTYDIDTWYIEK